MHEPIRAVDYSAVTEVNDLPVFGTLGPKKNEVFLRQHTLENGLRYVTIHKKDMEELYHTDEYAEMMITNIDKSPLTVISSIWDINGKINLGAGFRLRGVHIRSDPKLNGRAESVIFKSYSVDDKRVSVDYSLRPDYLGDGGRLKLAFKVDTIGGMTTSMPEFKNPNTVSKRFEISILQDGKNEPAKSNVIVVYNPLNNLEKHDGLIFNFKNNLLSDIEGVSQTNVPNPELSNEAVLKAIKKGENKEFIYHPQDMEASILTSALFGQNAISIDVKGTLDAIIKSTRDYKGVEMADVVKFVRI